MPTLPLLLLLVGDRPDVLSAIRAEIDLRVADAYAIATVSVPQVAAFAAQHDPAVILLLASPAAKGDLDVFVQGLRDERTTQDTPVLYVTTPETTPEQRAEALDAGVDGLLALPTDALTLSAHLRAMARRKAHSRAGRDPVGQSAPMAALPSEALETLRQREEQALHQTEVLLSLMQRGAIFHDDLLAALAEITEGAAAVVGTERVSIWRYSDDLSSIYCLDLFEQSKGRHSTGHELQSASFPSYRQSHLDGQVVVAEDVRSDLRTRELPSEYLDAHDICSLVDAPVWLHGRVGGIVSFEQVGTPRSWTPEDARFCSTVATLVSLSFEAAERARAEAALRESELRYRILLDLAPVAIAVHSDDRIVFTNRVAAELLGAGEQEQLIGKPLAEIVHPDTWPAAKARQPRMLAGEKGIYPIEDVYLRLDGTPIDVEVIATPLPFGGKPAVLAIVRDITERKRAERERAELLEQMQAQAEQVREILDTVPQGVLLLDADSRVLLANRIGLRDLATLAGVDVGERLTHLGDRAIAELLASAPTGPWHEIRAGQKIYEAIARPIAGGQAAAGGDLAAGRWVVVIDNVTYQRSVRDQLEQQERLAAAGQLTAGIAHDFNNILAIISLQASMACRSSEVSQRDRERLAIISEQTATATALIQQLLDFSRRAVLERRPLDLAALLGEQVKLLARTLPENIQVSLACEPGAYVVLADATRIQQLVVNLAVNARDAMPSGGLLRFALTNIEVASTLLPAGRYLRLTVSDSGTGIPPEALPHLFEPFFTTKPRGQGTGLGLAQVYGIVKQHAGEISVHSVVGEGVTFMIDLPEYAAPMAGASAAPPATPVGSGATVLLVEDNEILLETMCDIVQMLGYVVVTARNGKEALALLDAQANQVDLVLTDLVMPQMGGDQLLAAMHARGLATPVVILSGHPLDTRLESMRVDNLAGWLLKPPSLRDLAQLLAQALARSQPPLPLM